MSQDILQDTLLRNSIKHTRTDTKGYFGDGRSVCELTTRDSESDKYTPETGDRIFFGGDTNALTTC